MKNLYKDVSHLDQKCYDLYALSEDILMEHASAALADAVRAQKPSKVLIVAGPGNNGGDGIACARELLGEYEVKLLLPYGAKSRMCRLQLDRFYACGGEVSESICEADVVVDALFGTGLSRGLKEDVVHLIERLNQIQAYKIACDIPSGIDPKGNPNPIAFEADKTVTMGALKYSLFMDGAKGYVGTIEVADLGVSRTLYEEPSDIKLLETEDLQLPYRHKVNVHKGDFGHLGVVAGEKEGAAIMAALAALRYGVGLVSVVSHEKILVPYELMHSYSLPPKTTALAVGMGLGVEYSDEELDSFLFGHDLPMVVDADLFYSPKIKKILQRSNIVLTPHPKEFSSLLSLTNIAQASVEEIQRDRLGYVRLFCQAFPQAVLLLKGATPIIAQESQAFFNPHGSNALAKGGSGDVLTGLIGALLAQGYEPLQAAIQGSLAHAIASHKVNVANYALRPTDLIEAVGRLSTTSL